jgi:AcrR family transcriptional regulator
VATVKRVRGPTLREERAGLTRSRIAQAARRLFASRGYGATTLAGVAEEAGVAVQTVYAVYGSKAAILRTLREDVLNEPHAGAAFGQALAERDAGRRLVLFARSIRLRWEYGHDVVSFNDVAGATDPKVRKDVEELLRVRRRGLARIARSIRAELAGGLSVAQAAALLDALTLPSLYAQLVAIHGWTPDRFEAWLAATLLRQLLGRSAGSGRLTAPRC